MSRDLIKWLQKYKQNSTVYQTLFDAIVPELIALDSKLDDFDRQLNVETATWGLAIYEAELDVPINNTNKSLSERRSMIMAKMRGQGKFDATMIKGIVSSWSGGTVEVTFADSVFDIKFTDVVGIPTNIEDIKTRIDEITPAHLSVEYSYKYNQYQLLEDYTYEHLEQFTYGELNSSSLT